MSMIHSEHQVVTITAAVVALTLVACGHETQTQAAAAPSNEVDPKFRTTP